MLEEVTQELGVEEEVDHHYDPSATVVSGTLACLPGRMGEVDGTGIRCTSYQHMDEMWLILGIEDDSKIFHHHSLGNLKALAWLDMMERLVMLVSMQFLIQ